MTTREPVPGRVSLSEAPGFIPRKPRKLCGPNGFSYQRA
jgi:hypothetical protein